MPEELQNPSYEQVVLIISCQLLPYTYPKVISFKELVNVFFASQDPTTPNQQGPDRGSSYRSIAFIKMQQRRKIEEN
jgi:peptide-methionine (S)-S-oxide reductase